MKIDIEKTLLGKVVDLAKLTSIVQDWKSEDKVIVFTNGVLICFILGILLIWRRQLN